MAWRKIGFGKHSTKTLPQVLFSDPDWFFWAIEENVYLNKGVLQSEAKDLNHKARNIKIPNDDVGALIVEYVVHQPTKKFSHFDVVSADRLAHKGSSPTFRKQVIDMSVPREITKYDKFGCKQLLSSLKLHIFGSETVRFTKKRCEEFFNDLSKFA